MRLFVAIPLDDVAREGIARFSDEVRQRIERLGPVRLSWVPPERFHATVCFIGEVDQARYEAVRAALRPSLPCEPFVVEWQGLVAIPSRHRARVLACGARRGREPFRALAATVRARLGQPEIAERADSFTPHVTLARVKAGRLDARLLEGVEQRPRGHTTVEEITLCESVPERHGPRYDVRLRTPCAPVQPLER